MRPIEKVHIIGMGALGMTYGNAIQEPLGSGVVTYIMDAGRLAAYRKKTFRVNGEVKAFTLADGKESGPCDLLIVALKGPALPGALDLMEQSVAEDTIILSAMNGVESEEILGERFGREHLIYCVQMGMSAAHFGSDLDLYSAGFLDIGILGDGRSAGEAQLSRLTAFLDTTDLKYRVQGDILTRLWAKWLLNTGGNQASFVHQVGFEALSDPDSEAFRDQVAAMREAYEVGKAELGDAFDVSEEEFGRMVESLTRMSGDGLPSMGQDRINRKPSEVEYFAGKVLALGRKHGIETPVNRRFYDTVKKVEKEYL